MLKVTNSQLPFPTARSGKIPREWLINQIVHTMLKPKADEITALEKADADLVYHYALEVCFGRDAHRDINSAPEGFFDVGRIMARPKNGPDFAYGGDYHRFPARWGHKAGYNFLNVFEPEDMERANVVWIKDRFAAAGKNRAAFLAVKEAATLEVRTAVNLSNNVKNLSDRYPELVPFLPDMSDYVFVAPVQAVAKIGSITQRIADLTIPVPVEA